MTDVIENIEIKPGYRSNHSLVCITMILNSFVRGPGTWKFNTNLLKDEDYLDLVKKSITEKRSNMQF